MGIKIPMRRAGKATGANPAHQLCDLSCGFREPPFQLSRVFSLTRSPRATQVRASHAGRLAQPVACTELYERIANRSAVSERAAQGNLSQFNGLDFYCSGS